MMCYAWNYSQQTSCNSAGCGGPPGCPSINWFWWLAAGAGLLAVAKRKKRSNGGAK